MSRVNSRHNPYSISQNFLTSKTTIERLIRLTNINRSDHLVEIGAGKGHITKALLQRSKFVTASEIDKNLYNKLCDKFSEAENLDLENIDFLKSRLPKNSPYKVFANIPYSMTTDIIKKLTCELNPPVHSWLIIEKGAAKRFCGKPTENLNSLLLKPFFDFKIIYYLNKEDFHPAPSVDSVLLHIERKEIPDLPLSERAGYIKFMTYTWKNNLFGPAALLTKRQISTALRLAGLPQIERSGTILYVQWLCLFRCWKKFG